MRNPWLFEKGCANEWRQQQQAVVVEEDVQGSCFFLTVSSHSRLSLLAFVETYLCFVNILSIYALPLLSNKNWHLPSFFSRRQVTNQEERVVLSFVSPHYILRGGFWPIRGGRGQTVPFNMTAQHTSYLPSLYLSLLCVCVCLRVSFSLFLSLSLSFFLSLFFSRLLDGLGFVRNLKLTN